jgi:Activator of Hsp90 ATPase homolog 1-like protein
VLPRDEPRLRIQRDRPGRLAFKSTLEEVHRHARSASSRCWAAFSLSTTPSSRVTACAAAGEDDTRVIYRLEPRGGGTRVFFEQSGFESEQAFKGAEHGWTLMHGRRAKILQAMAAPRWRRRGVRVLSGGAGRMRSITARSRASAGPNHAVGPSRHGLLG